MSLSTSATSRNRFSVKSEAPRRFWRAPLRYCADSSSPTPYNINALAPETGMSAFGVVREAACREHKDRAKDWTRVGEGCCFAVGIVACARLTCCSASSPTPASISSAKSNSTSSKISWKRRTPISFVVRRLQAGRSPCMTRRSSRPSGRFIPTIRRSTCEGLPLAHDGGCGTGTEKQHERTATRLCRA